MPEFVLSPAAARRVAVASQGLLEAPPRPARKDDLLAAIRKLGALQIDTIHIVARSPYLALFSRLGDYRPAWLDELLAEGRIFEYWAHAACFLPAEDFPLHRRIALEGLRGWFSDSWYQDHRAVIDGVLETIRANGPARSADFERSDGRKGGTWWDWKIEKQALEYWFARGDLMTARRQNFQRVYDLRERVRPGWDDDAAPPLEQVEEELVLRAVRALGVTRAGWVWDYFRRPKPAVLGCLRRLTGQGRLLEVAVEGWDEPGYAHPATRPFLEDAAAGRLEATRTTLLSPFDSLISYRERARAMFAFDFTIECYLPASKRKYGYFLLPILHRGELIGRLDAKAHRKEKLFEVIALYLEPWVQVDEDLAAALMGALRECAAWHAAPELVVRRSDPPDLAGMMRRL
jgi:uncharacterized protein YcaQ